MDYYLGEIIIWSANWLPEGFAWCNGQMLNITENQALYAIIGTTYGGNGTTTFALPDLRGVFPLGAANGVAGKKSGTAMPQPYTNYGTTSPVNLPAHTHTAQISSFNVPATTASIAIPAVGTLSSQTSTPGTSAMLSVADDSGVGGAPTIYSTASASTTTLKPFSATIPQQTISGGQITCSTSGTGLDGAKLSVNMPGALSVNFLICVSGIFPSRA